MPASPVLIAGSIGIDTIETPFGKRENILGGSASYFAYAASFFGKVRFISIVGEDFDRRHVRDFAARGIDTAGIEFAPGRTFRWSGRYSDDMNSRETLVTELNVLERFEPLVPREWRDTGWVFLGNMGPGVQKKVIAQLNGRHRIALDTMNYWIENSRRELLRALESVDIFVLNDSEARLLSGKNSLVRAAEEILGMGPGVVIVKKGEHGTFAAWGRERFCLPAFPVERVVDPTGAGDVFAGGLMGYLSRHGDLRSENLRKGIVYGTILASFDVEGFGLQRLKKLSWREVSARYGKFRQITGF